MRIIDLSSPVDAAAYEPDPVVHEVLTPREGALHMAAEMREHFGVAFDPDDLPDGEFLSLDRLTLTSHTGTHVDAPSHYGSRPGAEAPRHVDALPLDWFFGPVVKLDARGHGTGVIGAPHLEAEFTRIGHTPGAGEIVVLDTGAAELAGTPAYFTDFAGLDRKATELLLDLGVRVIGTDAFSLDAPFTDILARYRETGDRSVLWPAHFAGRTRDYCQLERLANLGELPALGARIACFPVRIAGGGAGWTRAVGLLDD
ncbi:cyclase family protein [Actinokineospora bangkokensis]|uniref:Cyclase n=1 Tax=Actinokineospora bangkokensis TaxID=1193682 RepID=A0A1Q9LC26_9PSEU|nr:cyclase family protein [Actinokineospora bangkokensis]OLR89587.1 cyclase [Actinokineospora bangkokensis]